MRKRAGALIFIVSFMMLFAGCSKEKEVSKSDKEEKTEEVASVEESTESAESTEDSEEVETEAEEAVEEEWYPVEPGFQVTERGIELYSNEKGSMELIGDTTDPEGHLVSAVRVSGEMLNLRPEEIVLTLRYILSDSTTAELDFSDIVSYRFNEGENIYILRSSDPVSESPLRLDYQVRDNREYSEDEKEPEFVTVTLEEGTNEVAIEDLMEIKFFSKELNITRKDDKKEITLTGAHLLPDNPKEVRFTGTATYQEDGYIETYSMVRPSKSRRDSREIGVEAFAGIPVEFDFTVRLGSTLGHDEGAVIYLAVDDLLFPLDLRTGEEYMGDIQLSHLPMDIDMQINAHDGIKDNSGGLHYAALYSNNPSWSFGGDTPKRETVQFTTGGIFKELTVDVATGEKYKDRGGEYDLYFYGDDFETVEDSEEVLGQQLFHTKLKGDAPTTNHTVPLEGINNLLLYYNSHEKANALFSPDDEKWVEVILANGVLKRK